MIHREDHHITRHDHEKGDEQRGLPCIKGAHGDHGRQEKNREYNDDHVTLHGTLYVVRFFVFRERTRRHVMAPFLRPQSLE
jgi:hypothetical protein